MSTPRNKTDGVQAVTRAADILFAFSMQHPVLSAAEIANMLGLHRTTVHRLLATLERSGLVRHYEGTSRYTVNTRVLQLAQVVEHVNTVQQVAVEPMKQLRDETGETSALQLRDGDFRVVVAQVEAVREVRRTYPRLGELIPLHLGAPGRSMLAFADENDRERYLQRPLEGATEASIVNPNVLREDLATIARQGYAVSHAERTPGVATIAAPIFDHTGRVVASVNISGPAQRFDHAMVESSIPKVVRAAASISAALGYQGPFPR